MRILIEVDCPYVPLALTFHRLIFFCKIHTHEASQWGGLPSCAIGTGIALKIFFWQNSFTRLLIEVDCLYVPLALAFHWLFLAKFSPMRLLIEVDCLYVPVALAFHWIFFWQNSHSWGFSWTAVMCLWRLPFSENLFRQNSHSWGLSFKWTAMMCFWRWPFSENLFRQNSHSWGFSFRWFAVMCFWRLSFYEPYDPLWCLPSMWYPQ